MRIGFKLLFTALIISTSLGDLRASDAGLLALDTTKHVERSNQIDSSKNKFNVYLNISTGLFINRTTGTHPIIDVSLGLKKSKNIFNLSYEYRFGNSNKFYQIEDNGSLKNTNAYKASYIGFEYERFILTKPSYELYTSTGIGADWIFIHKDEDIKNNKLISSLALNIGIGYTFYFKKKHGPNIELLYHYADFKSIKANKIDNNSILIRLNYFLNKNN